MKRRDFITFIGGAVAWPIAARTQSAGKVYRVGWLFHIWKVTDGPAQPVFRGFVRGLRDAGYVEGQNLVLELNFGLRRGSMSGLASSLRNSSVAIPM